MASRRDFVAQIIGASRAQDSYEMSDRIARGLPKRALDRLKAEMDLTDADFAAVLGISSKTISRLRKNKNGALDQLTSDRVYRLARIFAFAEQVLGSRAAAARWLRKRQMGLGMRIPLDLMRTEPGAREVEDLLGRVEYSVLW
jgi:putative toxin-antitoxin system antitoxin component (TIGR02293 family)